MKKHQSASNSTSPKFRVCSTSIANGWKQLQEIQQLLVEECSYQIIPNVYQNINEPWKIVKALLPKSRRKILQVQLPYLNENSHGQLTNLNARYVLINQKVIGIRVKTDEQNWKRHQVTNISVPVQIKRYYEGNMIDWRQFQEIVVGEFYLSLRSFKIGLLFYSEVQEHHDIIDEFERSFGCDMLVVLNDLPKTEINNQDQVQHTLLQKSRASKVIMVSAGMKVAIQPYSCLWENPIISQGANIIKKTCINPFGGRENLVQDVDTELTKYHKVYPTNFYTPTSQIIKSIECRKEQIFEARTPLPKTNLSTHKIRNQKISMLYVWFLFTEINHRNPFTIGLPFTHKTYGLASILNDIYSNFKEDKKEVPRFLQLFFFQPSSSENTLVPGLQICQEQNNYNGNNGQIISDPARLLDLNSDDLYLYADAEEQIKFFQEKTKLRSNVVFCGNFLPQCLQLVTVNAEKYLRKCQNVSKNLEKLCDEILMKRAQTIEEMVRHFYSKHQSIQDMLQCFTVILPHKIRLDASINPAHRFLMESKPERIKQAIQEIHNLKQRIQPEITHKKNLVQIKERIKKAKNKQYSTCHRCGTYLIKNWTKKCPKCSMFYCYDCLDQLFGKKDNDIQGLEARFAKNCPICQKTCLCDNCKKKKNNDITFIDDNEDEFCVLNKGLNKCKECEKNRKHRRAIDVSCQKCKNLFCVTCLKEKGKFSQKCYHSFVCQQCAFFDLPIQTNIPNLSQNPYPLLDRHEIPEIRNFLEQYNQGPQHISPEREASPISVSPQISLSPQKKKENPQKKRKTSSDLSNSGDKEKFGKKVLPSSREISRSNSPQRKKINDAGKKQYNRDNSSEGESKINFYDRKKYDDNRGNRDDRRGRDFRGRGRGRGRDDSRNRRQNWSNTEEKSQNYHQQSRNNNWNRDRNRKDHSPSQGHQSWKGKSSIREKSRENSSERVFTNKNKQMLEDQDIDY